jgi:ribosomal-protein-alanine N-acetyltransferase
MNVAYRIRPAVKADIEAVAALERKVQNAPRWTLADYTSALPSFDYAPDAPGTRRCLFVAEANERITGFAVGRVTVLEDEVLAELESVAVVNSFRRAGIGRALCEAVVAWARERGAAAVDLEVRSGSDGAIALYKALGFGATGVRPRYYRDPADDAVLMRMLLRQQ